MGLRTTLVLLVLLGGLVGALWWSSGRDLGTDVATLTERALDGRSIDAATGLVVRSRMDIPALELGRERAGTWMLEEPLVDLAAPGRIEQLRNAYDAALLLPVYEPDDIDAKILAETGLEEPLASLEVRWPDGHAVTIEVGALGPFGHDRFVRRGGRIFRGDQSLFTVLQGSVEDWRDPFVFRHQDAAVVRSVRIDRALGDGVDAERETIVLRRDPRSGWVMEEPSALRLDQQRAALLVTGLLSLRADQFLEGAPNDIVGPVDPGALPPVVLEITGGLGRERVELSRLPAREVWFGHAEGRDIWFLADRSRYEQLVDWKLDQLRARWVISQPIDQLTAIRIELDGDAGGGFELGRDALDPFRLRRPVSSPADPTAVAELLNALRNLVAMRFVEDAGDDLGRFGLAAGHRVVELVGPSRRASDVLHVGDASGEQRVYLRRADEPHVIEIERAIADLLARPWTAYVSPLVLEIAGSWQVAALVGTAGDAAVRFVKDERGLWRPDGGGEPVVEVTEVFDLLRDLRAREVVDAATLAGDREPDARLRLESAEGAPVAQLHLFDTEDGDVLCRVVGREGLLYRLGTLTARSLEVLRPDR